MKRDIGPWGSVVIVGACVIGVTFFMGIVDGLIVLAVMGVLGAGYLVWSGR